MFNIIEQIHAFMCTLNIIYMSIIILPVRNFSGILEFSDVLA